MSNLINFDEPPAIVAAGSSQPAPVEIAEDVAEGSKPFPLDALPATAAEMARAIAETLNVPGSLAGPSILGILSASIGAGLQVESGEGRTTRGNLYLMVGAESGSGKSEAFRHAAQPFQLFAKERRELWERETLPGLLAREESLKAQRDALKRSFKRKDESRTEANESELERLIAEQREVEAELSRKPKVWTQDVTTQTLPVLMAGQPLETLSSLSADAREIIDIVAGKWNKGGKTDENFFVQAWTGDAYEGDRIGRSELSLNAPCLSSLWLVQPDKLEESFGLRSLAESGFLPRVLVCLSECEPQEIDRSRQGIPPHVSESYGALIRELLEAFRTTQEPSTITATPRALDALDDHYNAIVKRRRAGLRDVNSFAARWTEQAWRVAVCLHAGKYGRRAGGESLAPETAAEAIQIADWFAGEQLKILGAGRAEKERDKRQSILSLLVDNPGGVTPRTVQRRGIERRAEDARTLLERMVKAGVLKTLPREAKDGGRNTKDPLYAKA